MNRIARWLIGSAAVFAPWASISNLSGCGMEAAPSPPSLKLPDRVTDLAAVRAGNQVTLTWTTPKRDTDKVILKGDVTVAVCRQENGNNCVPAGTIQAAPGTKSTFTEALPPQLTSGSPRSLAYFIELKNHRG